MDARQSISATSKPCTEKYLSSLSCAVFTARRPRKVVINRKSTEDVHQPATEKTPIIHRPGPAISRCQQHGASRDEPSLFANLTNIRRPKTAYHTPPPELSLCRWKCNSFTVPLSVPLSVSSRRHQGRANTDFSIVKHTIYRTKNR